MELLLGKVTQQAMNYAIRSGITITASYAIQQSTRLLKNVENTKARGDLQELQRKLNSKMQILSPAIDMIELISARGNTTLESAVSLCKSIRTDLEDIGQKLEKVSKCVENRQANAAAKAQNESELNAVIGKMKQLLMRIDDAVPLINLAITTSGASLSTALPSTVSPSRLLQASTFLTAGDSQYSSLQFKSVQIGPTFTLSLYMLFSSHLRPQNEEEIRQTTWKEVIRKARVKLVRGPVSAIDEPPTDSVGSRATHQRLSGDDLSNHDKSAWASAEIRSDEFGYQLLVVEDFDDNLVHDFDDEEPPAPYDDVNEAGICEAIPIHEISKIFYANTGKILNIGNEGDDNHPVLLLKRDLNALPPRRMMERHSRPVTPEPDSPLSSSEPKDGKKRTGQLEVNAQFEREGSVPLPEEDDDRTVKKLRSLPKDLDHEWLAFEVFVDDKDSDDESEVESGTPASSAPQYREPSLDPELTKGLSKMHLNGDSAPSTPVSSANRQLVHLPSPTTEPQGGMSGIRTSLSLLETLLRLLSLQQFQQTSHLAIPDELLNFFLSEAATTGAAAGDEGARRRLRADARRRIGFDPYDESPIKRRGEEYQYRGGASQAGWPSGSEGPDGWPEEETRGQILGSDSRSSPFLLKDRASASRDGSPRRSSSLPRPPLNGNAQQRATLSPRTPYGQRGLARGIEARVSSPLARSATGMTDEAVVLTPEGERLELQKKGGSPERDVT